jgi:hypothetical protein
LFNPQEPAMKRNRLSSRKRMSSDALELGHLAIGLAESGGRLEESFWEKQLAELIDRTLQEGSEEDLSASLDRLFDSHAMAHDCLADAIEARAESCVMTHQGRDHDILLFSAPLLAWSRFSIPAGTIAAETMQTIKVHLGAHIFSAVAQIALADYLYSPDQLPRSFVDTWQLMRDLGGAALCGKAPQLDVSVMPETNQFLSDTRYLIGAVAVPRGMPIFRWNESDGATRESALKEWVKQGGPSLESLLAGCAFQPLLADAYHAACRLADMASRPYSLRASVAFLQTTFGKPAEALRAVIGGFYDKRLEEYRIGFGPRDSDAIHHGIVWPLLGDEDETTDVIGEVETILRESGVKEVIVHHQQFPFEFCDDCGAPLYPNVEGETVHAEMPDLDNAPSQTLH